VTAETLRLRSGPGDRYVALGLLHRHDSVNVDRRRGVWSHVELSLDSGTGTGRGGGLKAGKKGWVASRYLKRAVCMQLD
jgi:uncharacterized protein YraI